MVDRRSGQSGSVVFKSITKDFDTGVIGANTTAWFDVVGSDVSSLGLTTDDDIHVSPLNGFPVGLGIAGVYVQDANTIRLGISNSRVAAVGPVTLPMRYRVL
jgi:hypothetical protein